ncbi:MAG: ABC transporter ATP-binding protein, partial [Lachnospiraceae bacterium]|nr:ABC transporter ATP-binding protein [Lachnospiraceae bacterium]
MGHKPYLYLLDEVTAGMDPVFRIDFFKLLHKVIEDEQASVLMTSHIESEMEQKMDYLGILENGKLIKFGESLDVL